MIIASDQSISILSSLQTLVLAGIGGCFGAAGIYMTAYFKRKGENLATREDIDKLLVQVSAVTQTTKEIEAKISDDVWNRQKRWEMKRDVLFSAAKALAEVDDALLKLRALMDTDMLRDSPLWMEHFTKKANNWIAASSSLDETILLISLVCKAETQAAFNSLNTLMKTIAAGLANAKDSNPYSNPSASCVKRF